ncbi:SusD/RagB family nutrient-binding outer membrane lipoprotein [Maribellus sp. CM-23]|uniref:SusD/RagB family nutrient-binding outer membrane lipoprotein n=1 Tax=Maribellus sp. CM-23 TaxID=2781026 RepID=UPI001F38EB53|nr:SusD/RagB family nutrient-binding outer membrane lipoprotein [Maribellus sp. CM-23]MCE4565587.1 SusD/RagB family nutrient-binding outer membrane lipoprotein [Maribellus sp. CM-23]
MRNRKLYIVVLFLGFLFACTDDFTEMNVDTTRPEEVSASVLLTNAQIEIIDQLSSTNVNYNIWKLMAQYWTERSYRDEANYNITSREIPEQIFRVFYAALYDLKDAYEIIEAQTLTEPNLESKQTVKANQLAVIELVNVFVYQRLVDIFGDIPYSEALDKDNYTPAYDDAQTIYKDLIARAEAAVAALDDSDESFGTADLIYDGDVASWIKFGHSLLVKLGIGIADGPLSALGKSTVEAHYDGVFASQSESAFFPYEKSLPYVNELYNDLVASGRHDFVMVTGMVELMRTIEDPRIDNYFDNLETGITTDYGASGGSYSTKVHYDAALEEPDFPGFFLTFDEVQFYLAEAAARNWNVGADAETYYNAAVTASIIQWGGTEAEAETYLASQSYSSYDVWKDAIGTQAWLAMYTRGFIGYTFWRRLDYPSVLVMPPSPPTGVTSIPVRFTYPTNEQQYNSTNYAAAAAAIGGDKMSTKLFWDVY